MKKLFISLLAIAAMTSCTKEATEEIDPNAPVEIKMYGNILEAVSKAAIEDADDVTNLYLVRKDGTADWSTSILTSTLTSGSITFGESEKQYYPLTETNVYFMGFYPTGTISGTGVDQIVTFNPVIDNIQQDILHAASADLGTRIASTQASLTFKHQLARLNFIFKQGKEYANDDEVASIKIKGIGLPETMKLSDGTISFKSAPSDGITAFSNATFAITSEGTTTTREQAIMIQPEQTITLDITTKNGTTFTNVAIKIKDSAPIEAGKQYNITLTFSKKEVSSNGTVSGWGTPVEGTGDVQ